MLHLHSHSRIAGVCRGVAIRAISILVLSGAAMALPAHGQVLRGAATPAAQAVAPAAAEQQAPTLPMRYNGHAIVRVNITSARDLRTALALTDDVWSHQVGIGGDIDIRVSPAQFEALAGSGLQFVILIEDIQVRIDAERAEIERLAALHAQGGAGADNRNWFETYHPYDEIKTFTQQLATNNPDLATYHTIGQSLENRDIFAIRITGSGGTVPPAQRPAIFFNGCQHAREWVSPATVTYIANHLISNYNTDERTKILLDNVEVIIVPIVNPDGYVFSWTDQRLWRRNRAVNAGSSCRGVDTNRNFGYEWGGIGASTNPCNDTYRGPAAFSEPETQVIRDFMTANERIAAHIDFHSYSELILSPWGYTPDPPPGVETFDLLNAAMQQAIASVHGKVYVAGAGYTTIYPTTGTIVDWAWGDRAIYSWTIELRDTGQFGFVLPPDQIIPTAEENVEGVYALISYFLPIRFIDPTLAPFPVSPASTPAVEIGIENGSGTLQSGSAVLMTRIGSSGAFSPTPMQEIAPGRFSAPLPAAACGETIEYYFEAQTTDSRTFAYPLTGADAPFSTIAYEASIVLAETFEIEPPAGEWTIFNHPSLTSGAWERAQPIGSMQNGNLAAPNSAPEGAWAFVTQNGASGGGAGAADVDGGPTILTSPAFDVAGATHAGVSFSYWHYSVGGNTDEFHVELSDDDGQTWTPAMVATHASGWRSASIDIGTHIALTSTVRIRFISTDNPNDSVVEAGIDDLIVSTWSCTSCYANCDGSTTQPILNVDDFTCFINNFAQATQLPHAQQIQSYANCDGSTTAPALNVDDFTCFINTFAAGCP